MHCTRVHIHYLLSLAPRGILEFPCRPLHAHIWTVGGSQSTWRKTTQTQGEQANEEPRVQPVEPTVLTTHHHMARIKNEVQNHLMIRQSLCLMHKIYIFFVSWVVLRSQKLNTWSSKSCRFAILMFGWCLRVILRICATAWSHVSSHSYTCCHLPRTTA